MHGLRAGLLGFLGPLGCLALSLSLFFLCLLPIFFVQALETALGHLHLSRGVALLAVLGIFVGSLVNVPVRRIQRDEEQVVEMVAVWGVWGWVPRWRRVRRDTLIAVNVGGCVIPSLLAIWEVIHVATAGGGPLLALSLVAAVNVAVCWRVARPVRGVGIAMPGFVAALVAVLGAWLFLGLTGFDELRAPVAFVAGVAGPLIGADLLHLNDITKVSAGMLSIGGAGTFDGIVLSGVLAALLA